MAFAVVLAVIAYRVPHALSAVSFASVNPFLHSDLTCSLTYNLNLFADFGKIVFNHLVNLTNMVFFPASGLGFLKNPGSNSTLISPRLVFSA